MRLVESMYKDIRSIKLSSGDLEVSVLPEYGGKIASIYSRKNNYEFLVQAPGEKYRRQVYAGIYVDGECSGFDDMFPTIDECYYEDYPWKGTVLPDHGEVWSLKWDVQQSDDSLILVTNGVRLPYCLEKSLKIHNGDKLTIDYKLTNLSPFQMNFLWAAHMMVNIPEGTRIVLPESVDEGTAIFSKSGRIGQYGDTFGWPEVDSDFSHDPLDISRSADVKDMEKYYIKNKIGEGRCELKYPDGKIFKVQFSADTVPYLGILLNENGWNNNGEWNSLYNIFLEPCTSTFDRIDAARLHEQCSVLTASGVYKWNMSIRIS